MELKLKAYPLSPVESKVSVHDIIKAYDLESPVFRAKFLILCADTMSFQDFYKLDEDLKAKFIKSLNMIIDDLTGNNDSENK